LLFGLAGFDDWSSEPARPIRRTSEYQLRRSAAPRGAYRLGEAVSSNTRLVPYRHEAAYLLAKATRRPAHPIEDVLGRWYTGKREHCAEARNRVAAVHRRRCALSQLAGAWWNLVEDQNTSIPVDRNM
jgi:hypothetical protein